MKKKILFILLVFTQFALIGRNNRPQDYEISPDSFTVRFVDSITVTNYCIVESGINHQLFFIPDSNYKISSRKTKYWDSSNCIFYWERYFPLRYYMKRVINNQSINDFKNIWPYPIKYIQYVEHNYKKKKDFVCRFELKRPTIFARFLIMGRVYNCLSHENCLDCILPDTVDFKDRNSYYMVYVPIR